ncbi:MAG: segregation/condensation protein A [Mariprofundus sp.]|nr:segregation/condensation protein A [Mariprofundus sp.]
MNATAHIPFKQANQEAHALPAVHLDQFDGPLDILLHLIRSQELDIFDIPLAMITQQYLDILETQTDMDLEDSYLETAGDYLVMASTLMQLKSRLLLPRPEMDEAGNAVDPRSELAAQLLAYEQYRLLAEGLNERPLMQRDVFTRCVFPEADDVQRPLAQADLDALLLAFRQILKRRSGEVRHQIFTETISMREQMSVVLQRLRKGSLQLDELLRDTPGREALVTTVLAILELWRQQSIIVLQGEHCTAITLLNNDGNT